MSRRGGIAPRLLRFGRRVQAWIFRPSAREEVEDEVDFHLSMRVREYVARGRPSKPTYCGRFMARERRNFIDSPHFSR